MKTEVAIFTRNRVRTMLKTLNPENLISLIENVNTAPPSLPLLNGAPSVVTGLVFRRCRSVDAFNPL